MLAPAEVRRRKSQCFSSSWWPVARTPDIFEEVDGEQVMVEPGVPTRYVLLSRDEMFRLGHTGEVEVRMAGTVRL
jgi:hypothetical protein